MGEVWRGEGKDGQLEFVESFWSEDCTFCPPELMAEEIVNSKLPIEKMILGLREKEGSRRARIYKGLGSPTPTLKFKSKAIIGSAGFQADLSFIKGLLNVK